MKCDYCQRDNHNIDTCRLKQRHDKEKNEAITKQSFSGQLGNPQKRFKSMYTNATQVNNDNSVFRVKLEDNLPCLLTYK